MLRVRTQPMADLRLSRIVFTYARLEAMQLCVSPASFDQVVMRAILDQTTAFDSDYAICDSKRRESMRDDDHRLTRKPRLQVAQNALLGFAIQRAGELVLDELSKQRLLQNVQMSQ